MIFSKWNKISFLLALSLMLSFAAFAWPQEIDLPNGGKVVIYQPQPESLQGNTTRGRAAFSVKKDAGAEPVFGALFYEALLATDRDTRTADLEKLTILQVKLPGLTDEAKIRQLKTLIETEVPKWNLVISLDVLVASIEQESGARNSDNFKNDAPEIIYRNAPSTLVLIDGDPVIKNDKDLDADKVVNTPYFIFKEGKQWNLYTDGIWYKSTEVLTGWTPNVNLSKKLVSINDQIKAQEKEQNGGKELTTSPKATAIIVRTKPAELLQTEGDAAYKTLEGTGLLYVNNSPNDIFKDINSQLNYVLLAGRWYSTPSLSNGPYTYVPSDELPEDFARIPEGSEKDAVLANIAGTQAAEEALLDNAIPQTAKVDRKTATIDVQYDGNPQFKAIENTSLQLAENSNLTVMRDASGKYFALDNGVWFTSSNATGPWVVANERPKDVENIPANSEAYNTKYVYVYDSTPEYVYMGYTPGYMGSYIYGPTIVYGTGWYYRPWYGMYYYPRPVTWGFGFSYNPWYGWSFGFGFNVGFMHFGFGWGGGGWYGGGWGGGWFGPPMYRPPYRPWGPGWGGGYYGGGNTFINNGNININIGSGNNIYNDKKGVFTKDKGRDNIANRPATRPGETGPRPAVNDREGVFQNKKGPDAKPASRPDNNVFTDKKGDVFQRDDKGKVQRRDNTSNNWKPISNQKVTRDVNSQYQSRNRANTRTSNYNRANVPRSTTPTRVTRPAPRGRRG